MSEILFYRTALRKFRFDSMLYFNWGNKFWCGPQVTHRCKLLLQVWRYALTSGF